jgi:hypothetical protein
MGQLVDPPHLLQATLMLIKNRYSFLDQALVQISGLASAPLFLWSQPVCTEGGDCMQAWWRLTGGGRSGMYSGIFGRQCAWLLLTLVQKPRFLTSAAPLQRSVMSMESGRVVQQFSCT